MKERDDLSYPKEVWLKIRDYLPYPKEVCLNESVIYPTNASWKPCN